MLHADVAWAIAQASCDDNRSGRPAVAEIATDARGAGALAAAHEPLGAWGGAVAAVLSAARAD
eukprot:692606-Alexandrium_andersonii.AAC.1